MKAKHLRALPIVVHAEHRGGFAVHVTFDDDIEATLDFRQWFHGPIFEPLKQTEYFSRFFLDGGTVAWPNGADVAPEALYEAAVAAQSQGSRSRPMVAREGRAPYRARRKPRR
jgi:Protein of unknown function (DUF2442)